MTGSFLRTTLTPVAAVAVVLPVLVNGTAAWAAGTIDQSQLDGVNGSSMFYRSEPLAQTFTAGRSGGLDRVDLSLGWNDAPQQVFVNIREVADDGTPKSGAVLAKTVVDADNVEQFPTVTSVTFAEPPVVTAGEQYAVVVRTDSLVDNTDVRWSYDSSAPYAGGSAWAVTVPDGPWFPQGYDLRFATYVDPGVDADGDTFINFADCDDADSAVNPDALEVYNDVDDDCDDIVDEGFTVAGAPAIRQASSGLRGGAATATARWSRPTTNGGLKISSYRVQAQKLDAAGDVVARVTRPAASDARTRTVRLSPGRYKFRVAAVNAEGRSLWSRSSTVVRAR